MHTDLMATSFLKKIDFENSSADKCNTFMQQRQQIIQLPVKFLMQHVLMNCKIDNTSD
jgi:hypothetical protein